MPFCQQCKALVYPADGKLVCKKCGWVGGPVGTGHVVRVQEAAGKQRVIREEALEARPLQTITCPKCAHDKAFFHLMQTRRSDEPPTQINECQNCKHSWREY